jgi:hypothetical protein
MANRQVIEQPDGTLTIDDSSSAQKPGFDVPCPTRKQGCDNPQQYGQPEACHGSHNQGMTPIEEKLMTLCCEEANLSRESMLNSITSPNWSNGWEWGDWTKYAHAELKDEWSNLPFVAQVCYTIGLLAAVKTECPPDC